MSEQVKRSGPPRGFFLIVAAIAGLAVYIVMTSDRITQPDDGSEGEPAVPVVVSRDLSFVQRADTSVAVYDVDTAEQIDTLLPGHDKFLQHLLEKYRRDRTKQGISLEAPYRLFESADGRVTFKDLGTGRTINNVRSFGSENVKVFLRLLHGPEALP